MRKELSNKKILVFGLDGNLLDNYKIKSNCAGLALQKNVSAYLGVKKSVRYFTNLYIKSSGMNSIDQFKYAFSKIKSNKIPEKILERTERNFRIFLRNKERNIKIFNDAEHFLKKYSNNYFFCVTTAVPIKNVNKILHNTRLYKYIDLVCARNGVWQKNRQINIKKFGKGRKHYNYIAKRYKVKKSDLITVSSTITDILNAKKHNLLSIAVPHIINSNKLKKFNPDYIVKDFSKLNYILTKVLSE